MDVGDTFTPDGLTEDSEAVEDFYGARGYIDVRAASRNLDVVQIPNTENGTMDLEFQIDEGQKSYIEKIDIRGNTKTKDQVIRRELAVSPGEAVRHGARQAQQAAPRRPELFRASGHPPRADGCAGPQEPRRGRGGEEHRQHHRGRRVQLGGLAGRLCGINEGNFDLSHPSSRPGSGRRPETPAAGDRWAPSARITS